MKIIFLFVGFLLLSKAHSAQSIDRQVFESEPDSRILSIRPYSQRALAFAQVYSKLSDQLHAYIGEPAVITTLAFESHVVKDVSLNLEFLEQGLQVAKALQAVERKDFSRIGFFLKETHKILKHKEAKKGILAYGLQPFFTNPPWKWGWQHLDNTIHELEFLYENMSAMNMHIFQFMTTPGVSALDQYFKAVKDKAGSFDGWVDFADDHNQILKHAFRRLYLLKKSSDLRERQQLSYEFSILMIAFEQIYAQVYYDQIKSPHQKLAGSFSVDDPIGHYQLADASWADFRVRFSLPLDRKIEMSQVTPEMILMNSKRSGTIPDYYYSRITSPNALLMLKAPDKVKNFRATYPNSFEESQSGKSPAVYLLETHGCLGCHTHTVAGGSGVVGPDLSHVGSRLGRQSLLLSIVDPNLEISNRCAGGTCPADVMPKSYREHLTEKELQTLVDYLAQSR
jgi:hypothetical protein